MVVVSPTLIYKHVSENPLLSHAFELLEKDEEVQELIRMSNVMAVTRLMYNDHGLVHARIVSGTSLELFEMLVKHGVEPTTIRDGTAHSLDEARLVVLLAAYLHDIGNAVHRTLHEYVGALLAKDILDRLLPQVLPNHPRKRIVALRQEVMHAIFATEYNAQCLTIEAGVVKVSDGLDMSEGRARVPYRMGKRDMHAVSALSIRRVELSRGSERPIRITVYMDELAGLFQLEEVLSPKIRTSGLENYIEIYVETPRERRRYMPK